MAKKPKYETGNVGAQFVGKPQPANTNDKVLEKMMNAPFAENRDN